ncbi:short integuments 2, mitochondrial isoform X2 [Amborella trichopoda]|nr:short integuments 2, mitochondrial isoform X2 [Amborella trichopoda]|eukprot:XP_020528255.1 short integuments 2, mitochondrial isoform X2 [Amborella trichopoda]
MQHVLSCKRRVIALNKKDLANSNMMNKWLQHFDSCKQDCLPISAHNKNSVKKLLDLVELKLNEAILRHPTLLVMVVGVPNVGKSALINSIHQIASANFPVQEKIKRATVGPLPGVTQDIAGFKIAHQPSIYVLDTPGILVPSIPDIDTGLKLALTGAVKDSVVGEERLAQYLLALLNTRNVPLHWKHLHNKNKDKHGSMSSRNWKLPLRNSDPGRIEDLVTEVQRALVNTYSEFSGNLENENDLETLIEEQFDALQKAFKIPHKASNEAHYMVSKRLLTLFRLGKLGHYILDDVPSTSKTAV